MIEVEETSRRTWPEYSQKPRFPSGLLTMPIRKIKYFVEEGSEIENYLMEHGSIDSIQQFTKIYHNVKFTPKRDVIRLFMKCSYNFNYACIATSDLIKESLNNELKDQSQVLMKIQNQKNLSDNQNRGY